MMVKVNIKYLSKYKQLANKNEEELHVDEDMEKTYQTIVGYLNEKYEIKVPYILMINAMHINDALAKKVKIVNGDVFTIFPFMSGG